MFCGNCGKSLPNDAKFCVECGSKVEIKEKLKGIYQSIKNCPKTYAKNLPFFTNTELTKPPASRIINSRF